MTVRILKGVVLVDPEACCELRIYPDDDGVRIEVELWDLSSDDSKEGRVTRSMSWKGKGAAHDLKRIGLDLQKIANRVARG